MEQSGPLERPEDPFAPAEDVIRRRDIPGPFGVASTNGRGAAAKA